MSTKATLGRVVKTTKMPDLSKRFSPEQLAKAITAKRTGLKLSLVDVSDALALSKPTLIKIEKGDTSVKLVNLLKVMEYLGLSFNIIADEPTQNSLVTRSSEEEWF